MTTTDHTPPTDTAAGKEDKDPTLLWWDNPVSRRLSTRSGWDLFCDTNSPPPPTLPSRRQYEKWDDDTRLAFDRARIAHHSEFTFVPHEQVRAITRRIEYAMLANRRAEGAGAGVAISGPAAVGKSTLIRLAAKHHQRRALADPDLRRNPNLLPVIHVECPISGAPKPLVATLANFVGAPWGGKLERKSFDTIQECLFKSMDGLDVQLIVIDEISRLKGDSHGRAAANFIRHLTNTFPTTTIVLAGMDLNQQGPFVGDDAEGNRARFAMPTLKPFRFGVKADHAAWAQIVKRMEDHLLLFSHKPGDLTKHTDYLLARCHGKVGDLARLVREASVAAISDDSERITRTLLIDLDRDPDGIWSEPISATWERVRRYEAPQRKAS